MNRLVHHLAETHGISADSTDTLCIDALLSNPTLEFLPEHLEGQTIESIGREVSDSLRAHDIAELQTKLTEYRYVDEIYQLQRGKHVRWIRPNPDTLGFPLNKKPTLTVGGVVVDIKITDSGVQVLCKNGRRYIQYKFDDCLTYQKLSTDELLILTAIDVARPTSM